MELPSIHSSATASSPWLDMEAALHQLSSSCEPLEEQDVLMMDRPFLDYINEALMEEGMEDAACMQQDADADASYWAILRGFYEIVGEQNWAASSSGPDEQHVKVSQVDHAVISSTGNGNPHANFQQGTAEAGFLKPGLLHESHVETAQMSELHEVRNDIYAPCSALNESCNTTTQGYHDAINPHNGGITDTMVSSRAADAVEALITHTSYRGKEQGNSTSEEFALELIDILSVSFEDLKLSADYTALYAGERSNLDSSTTAARGRGPQNGDKKRSAKGSKRCGNKGTEQVPGFVDLSEVLVSCAEAVAIGDVQRANRILHELFQAHRASASGSGLQRIAHYFSKALVARMRGTGGQQFRAISQNMPSTAAFLMATKLAFEVVPHFKIIHYSANQSILKAAEGASRLHIVDYESMYGMQWPCLINALADRKGGPPLLVITGIEFPHPGHNPVEKLEASGRRLTAYASTYNVPFQYHAIATNKWEDVDATSLHLHEDEVRVVNCIKFFYQLADESIDMALTDSPRQKLLASMHSLNPHLLVFADLSAALNLPFFVSRFRETLHFYSNVFDMMDTLWGDGPERLIMEGCYHYRDILNIVACEGAERVRRPETYKQWQVCFNRAGFEQLPIPPTIISRSRSHVKQHYHKDFSVDDDANGWMLLGWKGRTAMAHSIWRPIHV